MFKSLFWAVVVLVTIGGYGYICALIGQASARRTMSRETAGFSMTTMVKLVRNAATIMGSLGVSPSIDDPEILRPATRRAVNTWLSNYHQERHQ